MAGNIPELIAWTLSANTVSHPGRLCGFQGTAMERTFVLLLVHEFRRLHASLYLAIAAEQDTDSAGIERDLRVRNRRPSKAKQHYNKY